MAPKKKSDGRERLELDSLKTANQDALVNPKTGTGTDRDKGTAAFFMPNRLNVTQCRALYNGSDLIKRIVNLPAREMTRRGWEVEIPGDKTAAKAANVALADLKSKTRIADALRKRRAFGGALVLINVTDGVTDPLQPIDLANLQSVDSITVFEPGEASALEFQGNPIDKGYGEPSKWAISPRVGTSSAAFDLFLKGVHPSRCFRISDERISRTEANWNHGFGESVIADVHTVAARVDQNYASTGALIDDFAQAVYKIRGLYKSMINDKGEGARKRLKLIDEYRSVLRGIILDADGEDFSRQPTPITGLSDLLDRFSARLAAAADMPLSVFWGKSPSGLAASGDMDVRMWYDTIAGAQELEIEPFLSYLLGLMFQAKEGPTKGKLPEDWKICFRPLWEPTEKEEAETGLLKAQARQIYNQAGALDAEKLAEIVEEEMGLDSEEDDPNDEDDLAELEGVTTGVDPEGNPIMTPPGQTPGAVVAGPGGGPAGDNVQTQALNGTQISSLVEVISSVLTGKISRESGVEILMLAFQLDKEKATALLGPPGFKPTEEPAPVISVPGAKPPSAPANTPTVPPKGG